jgi:uncharacterized phiE125 gp8 family phage protein
VLDSYGIPVHFGLTLTTDAAVEPLTATEVKAWGRIDGTAEDDVINALIKAARKRVEADTSRALVNQTFTLTLDRVPASQVLTLPVGPVSSVTSIKSFGVDDTESTISASVYRLDTSSVPARIVLKDGQTWPSSLRKQNALQVAFVAGYGAAAANITDTPLLMAMRLLIEHWYANRGAVVIGNVQTEIALGYQFLISPYRIQGVQ